MTFDDAIQLAQLIRDRLRRYEVLAIGRFVEPESITTTTPWAVSMVPVDGGRPTVLRSPAELDRYTLAESMSRDRPAETKPTTRPRRRSSRTETPVPTLF